MMITKYDNAVHLYVLYCICTNHCRWYSWPEQAPAAYYTALQARMIRWVFVLAYYTSLQVRMIR